MHFLNSQNYISGWEVPKEPMAFWKKMWQNSLISGIPSQQLLLWFVLDYFLKGMYTMYDDIFYTEMVNQIHGRSKMSTYSMSTNFMSLMASKNNPQFNYLSKNLTLLRYWLSTHMIKPEFTICIHKRQVWNWNGFKKVIWLSSYE